MLKENVYYSIYACENGFLTIVEYLISKDTNVEAKDDKKQTPYLIAKNNN